MRRILPIALAALLAACVAAPPQPTTTLPSTHLFGAGDPTRGAILQASAAFARPSALHGRPDAAARAVMALEHIAVAVPQDQMYRGFSPLVSLELPRGRDEVRGLVGIAPAAEPQAVIDALSAASEALRAGDRAGAARALPRDVAPDAARTLAALDALPPTPVAGRATAMAYSELMALDRQGDDDVIRRLRFPR
ncbi:MAG: hypothetical protein ACK4PG_03605 [Acetobacteraceae bacterium]